jgi:hypothetical protein
MNKIVVIQDVIKIVVYSDATHQLYIFNEITSNIIRIEQETI